MPLVKLDAASSTNDFLKDLSVYQALENYTVVTTEKQTAGKGQMGSVWISEEGKNLIMSILIKEVLTNPGEVYHLNLVVSMSVHSVLQKYNIPGLSIKWPNDIMSGNKKIAGILIENTVKSNGTIVSIAGIGLNVNQKDFINLPHASSLANIVNHAFDKEKLCDEITASIIANCKMLPANLDQLWNGYRKVLFKKGIPMPFEDKAGLRFMGVIRDVRNDGRLEVMLENNSLRTFELKEISMLLANP